MEVSPSALEVGAVGSRAVEGGWGVCMRFLWSTRAVEIREKARRAGRPLARAADEPWVQPATTASAAATPQTRAAP